jgi:hypothetical protein
MWKEVIMAYFKTIFEHSPLRKKNLLPFSIPVPCAARCHYVVATTLLPLNVPASSGSSSVLLLVTLCGCGWLYLSLLFTYGRQ